MGKIFDLWPNIWLLAIYIFCLALSLTQVHNNNNILSKELFFYQVW